MLENEVVSVKTRTTLRNEEQQVMTKVNYDELIKKDNLANIKIKEIECV